MTSPKTAYSILTIIADQNGFFEEEGLAMNINYVKTGKVAMDDLLGGNADVANIVETNVAFAGFLNADIEVYCAIEKVYDAGIVARRDAGIESPSDLSRKKIGVLLATTSQVFADRFFEKHGISKDSVEIVNLLPPAMQSAIIEGSGVDAISIWQPYVFNVQSALGKDNQITFKDTEVFTGYMTLSGNRSFAEKNPEAIAALIRAYDHAQQYVESNREAAMGQIAQFLNIPIATISSIWDEYELKLSLEESLISDTEAEGKWIIKTLESHRNKQLPDYAPYFNDKYLEQIKQSNSK